MLRNIFFVLVMIPGLMAAVARPYWALLLYLWFAFFRPDSWVWMDTSSFRLSLLVGVLLFVSAGARGYFPNLRHPMSYLILAFLGTMLLSQTSAINPDHAWRWIDFFARLAIVCLLTMNIVRTPAQLVGVVSMIALSMGYHGAKAGLDSMISGGLQFSSGLAGAFVDNNGYAMGLVMVIPFLLLTAQHAQFAFSTVARGRAVPLLRAALYVLGPLTAYAVISTFSRGGFLGLIVMTFVLIAVHPKRVRMGLAVGILIAAVVLVVQLPRGFEQRIATIQGTSLSADPTQVEDASAAGRLHFWRVAIDMVRAEPLGIGVRNYELAYDRFDSSMGLFGNFRAVHNSHLQVLAEMGYPGAAVWLLLFLYVIRVNLRIRHRAKTPGLDPHLAKLFTDFPNAMIASVAGFLVGGTFISLALNDLTWMTFALTATADQLSREACEAPQHARVQAGTPDVELVRRFTPSLDDGAPIRRTPAQ